MTQDKFIKEVEEIMLEMNTGDYAICLKYIKAQIKAVNRAKAYAKSDKAKAAAKKRREKIAEDKKQFLLWKTQKALEEAKNEKKEDVVVKNKGKVTGITFALGEEDEPGDVVEGGIKKKAEKKKKNSKIAVVKK